MEQPITKPTISVCAGKSLRNVHPVFFPHRVLSEGTVHVDQSLSLEVPFPHASEHGVEAVLIAAWALVLARHTNSETLGFTVGVPNGASLNLNVLEYQYDATGSETVSSLLKGMQEVSSRLGSPQDSSETADQNGNVSSVKYRNILLLSSATSQTQADDSGDHDLPIELDNGCSLAIDCRNTVNSKKVNIRFDSNIFAPLLASHLLKHLCEVIRLMEQSDLTLKDIDFSVDDDFEQINKWVLPCASPEDGRMLYSAFEDQVKSSPRSIAISQTEMVMSYKELSTFASVLARDLQDRLAATESVGNVGIIFDKSAYAIVSMLGIWKARGAYVPFDPVAPSMRIKCIVSDAKLSAILCSAEHYDRIQDLDIECPVICVDAKYLRRTKKAQAASESPPSPQISQPQSSDLAVIIYTSGSTGTPKGVALSHRALTTSIDAVCKTLPLSNETHTFQYAAFTFDISIADIWMTLKRGGCVCLPVEDERADIVKFIKQQRCSYTCLTTSVAASIPVDEVQEHLKVLNQCGEPLKKSVVDKFTKTKIQLINSYGPAEASVYCMRTNALARESNALNIGHSLGGSVIIVDANDPHRLAPIGSIGELAIFGPTLADEYMNDADKTSKVFRCDLGWMQRLSEQHSYIDRVYLTSDLVRYTGDGSMVYIGRKEGYIKLNGLRIEPGEIESQILSRSTEETTVCVQEYTAEMGGGASQYLACFFTYASGTRRKGTSLLSEHDAGSRELVQSWITHLQDRLPEYMVPRLFVPMRSMPMTPSGKIDKKRLKSIMARLSAEEVIRLYGNISTASVRAK